ncbi:MAG: hypothetical protein K0R50_1235 [Eubacterium sp.]|jgi:geranylgeranyl pyrophosphate synthase|nr:hypothetical protein [Eubacterium sp.]
MELLQEVEIYKEKAKLKKIFKDMEKNKKNLVDGLLNEAAFLVCLQNECRRILQEEGVLTETINATQSFLKEHPAAGTLLNSIAKYNGIIKTLLDHIPPEKKKASRLAALMKE